MILFPNAKINLGLNVVKKRTDGFHDIQTVLYPIKVCDRLEVTENKAAKAENIAFSFSGIKIPGDVSDNLCYRAYQALAADYSLPKLVVHLHKAIPIGAGLGGGSSDASFLIRVLNDLGKLGLSNGAMHRYARQLGSDCSFFIDNKPAFAEGRGDQCTPLNISLQGYYVVLVYPNTHVSAAVAYAVVRPKLPGRSLKEDIQHVPIDHWKECIRNDLEDALVLQFPEIKNIKEKLYAKGAIYAAMSGSGSTVYGIFKDKTDLKKSFNNYLVFEEKL